VANVIFTTKPAPIYDDTPEEKYHFPKRYLKAAQQAVGDWIIYYEPRRADTSDSNREGRQAYFAMARVTRIEPDRTLDNHFYAFIADYLEFATPVHFKQSEILVERGLRKPDGSTNRGAFQNSVRPITREDFETICRLGMMQAIVDANMNRTSEAPELAVAETQSAYSGPRPIVNTSRPVRDAAFSRVIRNAYDKTCAMTGLQLVNGGGRCEIEAAHIKPVEADGPDSPRNGIALSRTVHWMFDRGILSIADSGQILMAKRLVPEQVRRMINPDGMILKPSDLTQAPHPIFLRFHRETRYKGD